jgi:hypothetical protein
MLQEMDVIALFCSQTMFVLREGTLEKAQQLYQARLAWNQVSLL